VLEDRFGLSTRVFAGERLDRSHIDQAAARGFSALELVADRSHFDYTDPSSAAVLASWLPSAGVTLHAVYVPDASAMAAGDGAVRAKAVDDARRALEIAAHVPFGFLVLALGGSDAAPAPEAQPAAARRSLEEIVEAASTAGVTVAVEVHPHALARPASLVKLIEEELEDCDLGICLDYGRAHRMGDLADAIEEVSGYLLTTHVHDTRGQNHHLVPFAGTIDWDAAMMETQKIGYDGRLILDVATQGDTADTLARCAAARDRLLQAFVWPEVS
jgi:sugar phosphate isomerase/epimerase